MSESNELLVRRNREMMAERTALVAELQQARTTLAQRSVDSALATVEGIEQLIAQAGRGDRNALLMVQKWAAALESVRTAAAGIILRNGS